MQKIVAHAFSRKALDPKSELHPAHDEDSRLTLKRLFPRATALTNRSVVALIEGLATPGNSLAIAELMLEAVERTGATGWFASRPRLCSSVDATQLRSLTAGDRS